MDGDAKRQAGEQIKLPLLGRNRLNCQMNVSCYSQGCCLSEDLLTGLCRATGDN